MNEGLKETTFPRIHPFLFLLGFLLPDDHMVYEKHMAASTGVTDPEVRTVHDQ